MSAVDLLPCPFCGEAVEANDYTDKPVAAWVMIHRCKVIGPLKLESYSGETIAAAWNRRAPVSAGKVKALVWSQTAPPGFDHEPFVYWAAGIGGHYRAEPDGMLWMAHDGFIWQQHTNQTAAKAAAQADHDARVLSQFEPGDGWQGGGNV